MDSSSYSILYVSNSVLLRRCCCILHVPVVFRMVVDGGNARTCEWVGRWNHVKKFLERSGPFTHPDFEPSTEVTKGNSMKHTPKQRPNSPLMKPHLNPPDLGFELHEIAQTHRFQWPEYARFVSIKIHKWEIGENLTILKKVKNKILDLPLCLNPSQNEVCSFLAWVPSFY